MPNSIGRGIEWCNLASRITGLPCYCESDDLEESLTETKCPDLGDWSDTPHEELDSVDPEPISLTDYFDFDLCQSIIKRFAIDLDRDRLIAYTED
jgi:hypothetical protein